MFLITTFNPTTDNAFSDRILECIFEVFHYNLLVVIINHHERCLAEILVAYGNFTGYNVRQGVNERCRAREEVLRVLYRRLIMCVSLQRGASVEEYDGSVFMRFEISVSFNI